jgi:hypothetical protein
LGGKTNSKKKLNITGQYNQISNLIFYFIFYFY